MNIVFMGTPDFAVPSLLRLIRDGHRLSAVLTQPDKPKGRGYRLTPPPVKLAAEQYGIPVYQPVKLRDGTVGALLESLSPDLIVVVAYGRILPSQLLAVPPLGCINVHGSLLPKYRGAAPIQWSLLNGDTVTGVTTMVMAEGMDTGDMLLSRETPIDPDETCESLFQRLSELGADCLSDTIRELAAGTLVPTPQDETLATCAPMITAEMGRLDFTKTAPQLHNQIRAIRSFTEYEGQPLKVHRSAVVPAELYDDTTRLVKACGEGYLELLEVQTAGGKRMSAADFLRGRRRES